MYEYRGVILLCDGEAWHVLLPGGRVLVETLTAAKMIVNLSV